MAKRAEKCRDCGRENGGTALSGERERADGCAPGWGIGYWVSVGALDHYTGGWIC